MSTHPFHRPPGRPLALVPSSNPPVFDKFLALPFEIRTMIYRLALVRDPDPRLDRARRRQMYYYLPRASEVANSEDIIDPRTPSLLRTCWQIRNEGLPVFYSSNRFHLRFSYVLSGTALKVVLKHKEHMSERNIYNNPFQPEVAPQTLLRAFPPGDNLRFIGRLTALWSDPYSYSDFPWQHVSIGFVALGNKSDAGERDGTNRIGDNATNWDDEEEVRSAYIAALERPQAWASPPWSFGQADEDRILFVDIVRAMQAFKRRCPRAMEWVEAKAFWPRIALREWLALVARFEEARTVITALELSRSLVDPFPISSWTRGADPS